MSAKPMPLPQAILESVDAAGDPQEDGVIAWFAAYHKALAARGWSLWPQEPTEEMLFNMMRAYGVPQNYETICAIYAAARLALPSLDELLKEEK